MAWLSRRVVLTAMLWAPLTTAGQSRAQSVAQQPGTGPATPVVAVNDALLSVMKAGRATPFAQRAATLQPVIQRSFALDVILRASVGPHIASVPPDQQSALLAAFTDYTVASYVANFDSYSGERFTVSPQTRAVGAGQVVQTEIVPAHGDPTRLDYVMRQGAPGWQIADVLVDGSISRVAVQRSDFRSLVESGGVPALIDSLKAKAARLASGQKS